MNKIVERLMDKVDEAGAPPMAKTDWKELLERVIGECESRLEAVNEELEDGG